MSHANDPNDPRSSDTPLVDVTAPTLALALGGLLRSLARRGDAALLVATDDAAGASLVPSVLAVLAALDVRAAHATLDTVFDAIDDHTAALVVLEGSAELVADLAPLGPPVLLVRRASSPELTAFDVERLAVELVLTGGSIAARLVGPFAPRVAADVERFVTAFAAPTLAGPTIDTP